MDRTDQGGLRHIPRIGDIRIDGDTNDAAWRQGLTMELDFETRPGENTRPPVRTEVLLGENGSSLLVAFRAEDPDPKKIRAFLRDRDSAWNDDMVGIAIDTFNDEQFAFEFFVNSLGAQMDLTNDDINKNEDSSWDAIWDSAGRITDKGFEVEMSIPLQQLRFPRSTEAQTWGIDVLRFYPRAQRHRISNNPQDRNRDCYLCQLEKFKGFACAEPGRNLVIAPTMTINRSETRTDTSEPLQSGNADIDPGLDLRWGITPDLTLTATLNPDFSQVEADVAQLSVNEQFELFFPEKRPFFLASADFFDTQINAVFTRTIADPDAGAKLIGKHGANNYGLFAARDSKTNLLFPGTEGSGTDTLSEANNVLVGRYRRDFGNQSAIGLLATGREGDNYSNWLTGADGRYRFNETDSVSFQYLHSTTRYPESIATDNDQKRSLSDQATLIRYDHRSRNWRRYLRYDQYGKDFRADLGFVTKVGFDRYVAGLRRTFYPGESITRMQVGGDWDISHTEDGRVLEREIEGSVWAEGPFQSFMEFGAVKRDRLYNEILFPESFAFFYGNIKPFGGQRFELFSRFGRLIDFSNSRLADSLLIEPEFALNLGKHLEFRLRHSYQSLDSRDSDENIFTANLSDIRLTWQFDVRSFLRLVVQHQDIERNTLLYTDDVDGRDRSLSTQLLYSYKINPQTVLFIGYSDAAEDGDRLTDFTTTNKTFFAKFGYAWLP
ncbi:MAG: carbohydrate binding family 9 domain-containing protein [Gammaproteobacteria bacterium]|nr:carbohydrate binding family 9 domain-containing protein [Gammaproteobacteria bacterium]